nr:MAG TPA: hypothetical protein [Caudoviricetes sp.]
MSSTKNRMIMGAFSHDRVVQLYNMLSKEAGLKETRDEAIASLRAEFHRNAYAVVFLLKQQESNLYEKLLKILDEEELRVVVCDAMIHFFLSAINTIKFLSAMSDRQRVQSIFLLFESYVVEYTYEALSNNPTIRSKFSFFKKSRTRHIAYELAKALERSAGRHFLFEEFCSRILNCATYTDPYAGTILPKFVSYVDEDGNVVL